MPPAPTVVTWDDFVALAEDDRRELIDGELVEVEVPNALHEHVVALLIVFLGSWIRPRRAGLLLASGYKVKVSERRGFMPDIQFFRKGNLPSREDEIGLRQGHPDLAVEVVSPSSGRYDRVTKLNGYASIGTPEYWIVDPEARTLERLALSGTNYVIVEALAGDEVFRPASFDGLEIPLRELWELDVDAG